MAKVIGEGTIVQLEKDKPKSKCRKWQLRVPVGLDPRTGKYKTRTRRVNDMTYTQAKKALRDFIEEIEDDRVWRRTGTTFEECAADFMERRDLSGEFSQNTQLRYRRCFKAVSRHIGKAEIALITPEMIEDMYAAMRQGDTLSGKPSSGAYLTRSTRPSTSCSATSWSARSSCATPSTRWRRQRSTPRRSGPSRRPACGSSSTSSRSRPRATSATS
ncbi:MAG: hypothetical protein ACLTEX_02070 [Eggerthella lenta]